MTSALPAADGDRSVDVIVVGAGPGGSATAAWLAKAGKDVVLLEKSRFPRDKICGDGLTPRAVRQLINLGIPLSETDGWAHNKGLRIIGGGMRLQLDWPEVDSFPSYGMVRGREDLDEFLARHAERCGATLVERRTVTQPALDQAAVGGKADLPGNIQHPVRFDGRHIGGHRRRRFGQHQPEFLQLILDAHHAALSR